MTRAQIITLAWQTQWPLVLWLCGGFAILTLALVAITGA